MKAVAISIAKVMAKFVLKYVGDAVVETVKYMNSKSASAEYREVVLTTVEHLAADIELISQAMNDGEISDEEAERIKAMIDMDMESIRDLL